MGKIELHVGGAGNGVREGGSKAFSAKPWLFTLAAMVRRADLDEDNYQLESCMRENRTYSSEGGDGGSRFRPLLLASISVTSCQHGLRIKSAMTST